MKIYTLISVVFVLGAVVALPRQEGEGTNRLDQPLSDPELRRTLLRVFAESLKAAAEAGVAAGARSAVNVPVEEIFDLRPPGGSSSFFGDQQPEEVLLLSGDSAPRGRAASSGVSFTTTTTERPSSQDDDETPFNINLGGGGELLQGDSSNHGFSAAIQQDNIPEPSTESSPAQPPAEPTFPGPSPAPPSPTPVAVTVDESSSGANLSPADDEDVKRFVSAVKTTDETLGEGVELFQAPLIAAFALQQDGNTGLTRSLHALPVNRAHEDLLKQERQILSVAGQVIGTQRTGILTRHQNFRPQQQQQDFGRTTFDIQQSVQPDFSNRQQNLRNFESSNNQLFLNEVEPQSQIQRLERRQQELQQQLITLQRERSALLLQRNTRSETVQRPNIPIYLQPPFF